jgi:flagellar L-ring protein FlgH
MKAQLRMSDAGLCSKGFFRAPREVLPVLALGLGLLASPTTMWADSLWTDSARPMFADKRGTSVGDILTIIIQESNSTSKDNNTKTSKKSGVDASISSFLYSPGASGLLTKGGSLPALKFDSKTDFDGGGAINNSEKIIARIAVRVIDVLPNRNLVIEGSRDTAFSGEEQTIVLRGVVRPEDIAANNTVYSYNVADSTIRFVAKGTLTDSQKKGWFTKIWDKVSPF